MFEKELCEYLANHGYWVHFITPDARGAQPFDIIAVKNGRAVAIDCKTSSKASISIGRLEENQKSAFDSWLACGNSMPQIAVKYNGRLFFVPYEELKKGTVKLTGEGIEL